MNKRKALSLFLALSLCVGMLTVPAAAAGQKYDDTAGHWAESAIERWSEYKIVEGDDGHFHPNRSLTRGEMAKILANTLGLTDQGEKNPFADVPADAWYTPFVLRCAAAGIMEGDGINAHPTDVITRQETMTVLGRALNIEPVKDAGLSAYADGSTVADWAKGYVAAMTKAGVIKGIGENLLAPTQDVTRASIMAILDRSVAEYINASGTYDLTGKEGLVLVAAGNVTITGKSAAHILVTAAATGKELTFDKAEIIGSITVQADNAKVVSKNGATLPKIVALGKNIKTETIAPKPSRRPSSSGGGSSTPSYSNLTVAESKTVDEAKTYQDVTITDAVGDGTVTLANMTILGNLYINGGGAHTVNLTNVVIKGKIIMAKVGGETPRLNLVNTPVNTVEVEQPATIQADAASTVAAVQARASVYAIGSDTVITAVTVPAGVKEKVYVVANDTAVVEVVNAKSETAVTGATNSVKEVVAEAPVTVTADAVKKVEVPATAPENITVAVTGAGSVEVAVNSEKGAAITTEADEQGNKASVEVSTKLDTPPTVTVDGEEKHIHQWGAWEKVDDIYHKRVCKADESHVETEKHPYPAPVKVDADTHKFVCPDCGNEYVKPHTIVAIGEAVAADCLGPGKTAGKKCTICNTVLKEQKTIEPLGHDFSGKYINDADGHWHKCTRCDKTDEKAAHAYPAGATCDTATNCTVCNYEKPAGQHTWDAGKVTKEPTETEAGIKTYTCTTCKATKTEAVPAVGKDTPITFTQNKNEITASWTGFSETKYAYCFRNQSDERVTGYYWTQEGSNTSYNLHYELPRLESGTASYDFVLYAVTNNMLGQELARVKNAATVTVAGEPISYNMDFAYDTYTSGSTTSQKSKVTWPDDKQPAGIWQISAWYRGEETAPHAAEGGSITPTLEFIQKIQDGDIFDLRILTTFELDGQTIKATMTPASTKTYTATGNDPEVGDEITIGTPELKTDGKYVWLEAAVTGTLPDGGKIEVWDGTPRLKLSVSLGSSYLSIENNILKCYLTPILYGTEEAEYKLALAVAGNETKTEYTAKTLKLVPSNELDEVEVTATKASDNTSMTITPSAGNQFADTSFLCKYKTASDQGSLGTTWRSATEVFVKDTNAKHIPDITEITLWSFAPTDGDTQIAVTAKQYKAFLFSDAASTEP